MINGLKPRYLVKRGDSEPKEVDEQGFISAEKAAGFNSKTAGEPATGGFSDSRTGIEGCVVYTEQQVAEALEHMRKKQ